MTVVSWDQVLNDHVRAWVVALLGAFIVFSLLLVDGYGRHLRRENTELKTHVDELREQPWRSFLTYIDSTRTESLSTPGGGSGHNHWLTSWQWTAVRRIVEESKRIPDLDKRPGLNSLIEELFDDLGDEWRIYATEGAEERNKDATARRRNIARFRHGLSELRYWVEQEHLGGHGPH